MRPRISGVWPSATLVEVAVAMTTYRANPLPAAILSFLVYLLPEPLFGCFPVPAAILVYAMFYTATL